MKHNKKMRAAIRAGKEVAKETAVRNEKKKCIACNGSGRYDNTGSPKCSACNGTGLNQEDKNDYS